MFYKFPKPAVGIKQGDIFRDLPFTEFNLNQIIIVDENSTLPIEKTWEQVKELHNIIAAVKIVSTPAIVISQDCDNLRNDFISLARIQPIVDVTDQRPSTPKNWTKLIIKGPPKANYQWFYLPEHRRVGFSQKMAVNFDILFQLPKDSLLLRRNTMRKASLNELALNHFRDNLVKYFTRYAYNEWYSFSKQEFQAYKAAIVAREPEEEQNLIPYRNQR